jgi:hypothetical protein
LAYQLVELLKGGELVGGQFEGEQGVGVDAQVLQLVAAKFVLAQIETVQLLVGWEVFQ